MDVKEEPESEDEIIDVPDLVELTYLEKIKNESIEIKSEPEPEPVELTCGDCNEKFTNEVALRIHEMFHSKTNYCFVCKRNIRLNFHEHITNRHSNHVCGICTKVFTLKKTLDNHIRSHTKDRIFKCEKCDKSFMQRGALTSHFMTTHEGIKPFVCQICEGTFTTSSSLKKHIRKMHSGNEIYECRICYEKFSDKKKKWDHERKHTHSKECDICGKVFKKTENKTKHHVTKHFRTEECIYCQKMFHKSLIDAHIVEIHPPRDCDVCNKTFYEARLFNNHRLSHSIRITCTVCGRNYKEEDMEKHLQMHREDKIKKCTICNSVYIDIEKHNLRVHKNTNYCFCHLCKKKFRTQASKSKHVFRVHLRKLEKCNFCSKRFKGSSNLREHLNKHYRIRPYKCLVCKMGFKYLHRLENHKKQHDLRLAGKDYKLSCSTCGRKFKIELSLKQHKCMAGKLECCICGLRYKGKHYLKRHLITYHSPTIFTEENINENNCDPLKSTLRNRNLLRGSTKKYQCKKCRTVFTHCNTFKKHFCNVQRGYSYSFCRRIGRHAKVRRPEKKLKCDMCEYVCINKVTMRKHYVRMHVLKCSEEVNELLEHCVTEIEKNCVAGDIETTNEETKISTNDCS